MSIIRVGMADFKVSGTPHVLRTNGLGSCIGLILYDKYNKIGGLLHLMLPYSDKENIENKAKFANTGIAFMLQEMEWLGAERKFVEAHIVGGANMFFHIHKSSTMKIGEKNINQTKKTLEELHIPIILEETGGYNGRTIEFNLETGELCIVRLENYINKTKE